MSADSKRPLPIAECTLVSPKKKAYLKMNNNNSLSFGSKGVSNCRKETFQESSMCTPLHRSNHNDKAMNKESLKMLSKFANCKRPRIDQHDNYLHNFEADEDRTMFQKDGLELIQSPPYDKTQMTKQKRAMDGKRTDRKSFRFGFRTRCDLFASKGGLICGDSHSGGNNILGTYGLKSDHCDVTKLIDEPSLHDLLDGSYKYSNVSPVKGNRPPNISENILFSVRKALCHLPHCATDSHGEVARSNLKPSSLPVKNLVHDKETKSIEELRTTQKTAVNDSELLEAKDVFERLALPLCHDLDSLLVSPKCLSQLGQKVKSFRSILLPPFPWTVLHGCSYRHNADSVKQILNRNTWQSRWFRIVSSSSSITNTKDLLADLELAIFNANNHSLVQQKGVPFSGASILKLQNKMDPGNFTWSGAEATLAASGSHSYLADSSHQFTENGAGEKILHTSNSCYNSDCKNAGSNQATQELYKPGCCPQVFVAADILFEIASCCNATRPRNESGRKMMKSWNVGLDNAIQSSFKEVTGSRSPVARHFDPTILIDLPPSSRQHLEKKYDFSYVDNHSRGHKRIPLPPFEFSGASNLERERNVQINPGRLDNGTIRPRKLIKSLSRVEKGYNNQQYLRKMQLAESTVGLCIKDWNSGRRKKSGLDGRS